MSSGKPSSESSNPQKLTDKKKAEEEIKDLFNRLTLQEGKPLAPPRKAPGTSGKPYSVDTNIYQLKTDDRYVYRYDVSVTGTSGRGKEVDLTKRSESSAVIADRITNCRDAFRAIFHGHPEIFGQDQNLILYDLQSILYTLNPLNIPAERQSIQLVVNRETNPHLPQNLASITMEIKNVKEDAQRTKLDDLSKLINAETLERDRSVLNFIELAVNQYPMMNDKEFLTLRGSTVFFIDGKAHGLPEKELDRTGTKYLASGVQKSATLIEGFKKDDSSADQRKMGLLLEAKHSPFHTIMPLLQCIELHQGTQALAEDFKRGRLGGDDNRNSGLNRLTRIFKKMQMIVLYPDNKTRKIELKSFDNTTARTHIIQDLNKSVADYFYEKYNKPLRFPDAHLVCVKQGGNKNYYPVEFLQVADNQVVTAEQMDAASKASMIRECAVRPDIMRRENENAAKAIHLHDSDYTRNAGIQFSRNTLEAKARILNPPVVAYKNSQSRVDTREAAWRMGSFLKPAACENYAIYLLSERQSPNMTQNDLKAFQTEIERFNKKSGMQLGQFKDCGTYDSLEVETCVQYCADNGIGLCLFITPDNIKTCHSVMKMCEHRYNVVTQDMQVKTAKKMLTRGASATLENYLAKTNLKLGGLNHSVETDDAEIMKELTESLFVGISTNQPGSKTIVDRARSVKDDKPGVLGFCANMGKNYNEYLGDFFFTPAYRPELYSDLREIFKICVKRFTENRGHPPKTVFFYYTGLAEGQFSNAYKWAIPLIKDGIREGNGGVDIPFTLLAVQKMNNIRLFPKKFPAQGKDFEFNVPHGTVVDSTIVNPVFTEFYLVPHSALKGTGRVPRYTVIQDDTNFSLNLLEGLTHVLSYEHQIVARATSLPTPVYVAEGYAQRGRDVFNAEYLEHFKELPRDGSNNLDLSRLSEQLNYSHSQLSNQRINA